jgi:hypothetical protein
MKQIPHGPDDMICPLHKKAMATVCHKCPLWTQVRGKHPQSEEEIDRWDCSLAWLPMLLIENAQQSRQTGAAVESFRNEMVKVNELSRQIEGPAGSYGRTGYATHYSKAR